LRKGLLPFLVTGLVLAAGCTQAVLGQPVLVDRILAVADDEPIFLSDVEQAIALEALVPATGETSEALRRQVLDRLIDQRLQLHEVERFDAGQVSPEEVEHQLTLIRSRFQDDDTWKSWLVDLGLDEAGVRHVVTQQLKVLRYVAERLAPRIFVDQGDVRSYYEGELTAEMQSRGEPVPPISEIREAIRALLREQRLNVEIETWTQELRLKADVVDHLERGERDLPDVALVLEAGV
jgi:hypothetical protein